MDKIRGKSLQEWKEYCESDNVPIKTMKYITVLEEQIAAISVTRCSLQLKDKKELSFEEYKIKYVSQLLSEHKMYLHEIKGWISEESLLKTYESELNL